MFQGSKHVPGDSHFQLARRRRRQRHQRHDRLRSHELLRDVPVQPARAGAVARVRPHGLPARRGRPGEALEPAGRRAQRAPPERREPAVRHRRRGAVPPAVPERPSLLRHVIGSHADIQAAKLEDVQNFFKQYYAPNNASLAIVGDIDKAATKALVEKYFGTFKRGPAGAEAVVSRRRRSPPNAAPWCTDRVELPRVYMAWLTLADLQAGRRRRRRRRDRPRRRQVEPARTSRWSTRSRSRRTCRRAAVLADARVGLSDRGDRAARPHGGGAREGASTRS